MINLSARIRAQKLMWIKRFSLPFCAGWKFILGHYLSGVGGLDFLRCNFDVSKLIYLPFIERFYHFGEV